MGNQQGIGGHLLPSTCVQGSRRILHPHGNRHHSLSNTESDGASGTEEETSITSDDDSLSEWRTEAAELENIIINNDTEKLKQVIVEQKIDINTQLNEKDETALILAVKLSHLEVVKVLLSTASCEKNSINVRNFSALDVALITAFDNRLEPRQTICWEIIECLLQVDAEPSCRDAMMYVVRTALKFCDEAFLYRLIFLAQGFSSSVLLHEFLLQKLHRHQPVYIESLDPILMAASQFTMKLLKNANGKTLGHIVNSMVYYLESYWHSRVNKINTFKKLIVYATGAGWDWPKQQLVHIDRVCPSLGVWCKTQRNCALSLYHTARVSFRQNVQCLVPKGIAQLPHPLPESIKDYLLLKDIDDIVNGEELSMADISL